MTTLFALLLTVMHPFHVSVSDIKFKEDQKAIQVSTRIFLDDLELALQSYSGDEKLDIMDESKWEFINQTLEKYLLEKVVMKDGKGRNYTLQYVGAEIEEEVMWCYLEVEKVKKLQSVTVTNKILHEVWADQENLVHFRAFDQVKSARLFFGQETEEFSWK